MQNDPIRPLTPDLQVGFHYRLKTIKDLYFHEALRKTVERVEIRSIDDQLNEYVDRKSLQKLASFGLRGETVFPIPAILSDNPYLIGYYRLLYGFSQKEFYFKGPYGQFKSMEEKGRLTDIANSMLPELCQSLIYAGAYIVKELDFISLDTLHDLQLLTVGPQFRGSMNNTYGQAATQKTFQIIKKIVGPYIQTSSPNSILIVNDSQREVQIKFSSDPDIEIVERLTQRSRGLISIEIKGGRDVSNIHNRIGEAEKSHQKARNRGYFEFMTIISVEVDYKVLKQESPTTTHFFNLDRISENESDEFNSFKDILSSVLSIKV